MDIHCSSIDVHLGCFNFWLLWIMLLRTSMYKFCVEYVFVSLETISRSGIAESYGNSMFSLLKNCQAVLHSCHIFYISNTSVLQFQLSHILSNKNCLFLILIILSVCEVDLIVGLIWVFLVANGVEHVFMSLLPLVYLLWGNFLWISFPLFLEKIFIYLFGCC